MILKMNVSIWNYKKETGVNRKFGLGFNLTKPDENKRRHLHIRFWKWVINAWIWKC